MNVHFLIRNPFIIFFIDLITNGITQTQFLYGIPLLLAASYLQPTNVGQTVLLFTLFAGESLLYHNALFLPLLGMLLLMSALHAAKGVINPHKGVSATLAVSVLLVYLAVPYATQSLPPKPYPWTIYRLIGNMVLIVLYL